MTMNKRWNVYVLEPSVSGRVQLFRSLVVGAVASVVDLAVMTLCYEWVGLSDMLSTAVGFTVGLVVNFILTRLWVFTGSQMNGVMEFLIFAVIGVIGLALSVLIVWVFNGPIAEARLLGSWLPPERYIYPGKITAIVVVFFWNFLLRKFVVYRK